ncbi:YceD family protein [Marinobacter sp. SS21]|uniref:YceD family protein n=1 Tax=Marinobacter sp. SS21 TaxID=2979460 RepID=UPI00232C71C9|nr:YceD family protein [Marinobacter sp. SS21]MDC0663452.1 YceD family protein [Marinobacter sp. SS21]
MSNAELPKTVDPYKLAEQSSVLEGRVPLKALDRFSDCVAGIAEGGQCQVSLAFSMDDERRRVVSGELEAEVELECQRCMTPMQATLTSQFRLGLVTSDEQAQRLPKELEPFLTDEFSANLWTLVEDELLLVLPPFPVHALGDCPAREQLQELEAGDSEPVASAPKRENPFSVLAGLKTKKH